SYLLFLKPLC
ncbi:transposase IS66 family protein, partial [Trichonephila inaurata madagascariensis]